MSRGTVLGSVLLMITAAMIFAVGAASVGMFNLSFATATEARESARNLAESALNLGIASLLENDSYGTGRLASETIQVPGPVAGSLGSLSFNLSQASAQGVHYSTNNLANATATSGDGRSVPGNTCHLVGVGRVGSARIEMECLFYRPPFPKGLAASGNVSADGLVVAGVKDPSLYTGSVATLPPDQQLPGNIFSNSNLNPAVRLGPDCKITGDVGAVGSVNVDPSDTVGGEVRAGAAPQDVPSLDVPGMISRVATVTGMTTLGSTEPTVSLTRAYAGTTGNLEVTGDVALSAGVLFVGGNLTIDGTVTGSGAILVGNATHILHGSQLTGGQQIALASKGDVELDGQGSGYYFHGLVYTEGDLSASDLAVVGTVVTNAPPGKGSMRLQNVQLIQSPVAVTTALGSPLAYTFVYNGQTDGGINAKAEAYFDPQSQQLRYNVTATGSYILTGPYSKTESGLTFEQLKDFLHAELGQAVPPAQLPQTGLPDSKWDSYVGALSGNQTDPDVLSFNLNSILAPAQRSRILWWHQL